MNNANCGLTFLHRTESLNRHVASGCMEGKCHPKMKTWRNFCPPLSKRIIGAFFAFFTVQKTCPPKERGKIGVALPSQCWKLDHCVYQWQMLESTKGGDSFINERHTMTRDWCPTKKANLSRILVLTTRAAKKGSRGQISPGPQNSKGPHNTQMLQGLGGGARKVNYKQFSIVNF